LLNAAVTNAKLDKDIPLSGFAAAANVALGHHFN
jgi:hypothetical protein